MMSGYFDKSGYFTPLTPCKCPKILKIQTKFCQMNHLPDFMDTYAWDGYCHRCGVDVTTRITEVEAATKLFTGCPACPASWCD